jgi:hypothetical protein
MQAATQSESHFSKKPMPAGGGAAMVWVCWLISGLFACD